MELTKEQIACADELKDRLSKVVDVNPNYCLLCPQWPEEDYQHWYCPILDGEICSVCCQFDMDDVNWPRGKWPEICDICGKNKIDN